MRSFVGRCLWVILLGMVSLCAMAKDRSQSYERYIERYYRLAQEHQARYHIPASITLAQGLLESAAGESDLAIKANNHFGVKCHDWKGASVHYKGSCYRKYDKVSDSFQDHSEFLLQSRYSALFELKTTDYKGWARGLKRCGYATDPSYATKLINIIETYKLMQYDKGVKRGAIKGGESLFIEPLPRAVYQYWGLLYVEAEEGDTYVTIAADMGFDAGELARYNDNSRNAVLSAGEIVYLQPKMRKAHPNCPMHNVLEGETFYSISQRYGIDMKRLARRNQMRWDDELEEGLVLMLR